MLIAIVNGSSVEKIGDYRDLFPNTSFSSNGPNNQFLSENSAMKINVFLPYDSNTQMLVSTDPYVDGDFVTTVKVIDKPIISNTP